MVMSFYVYRIPELNKEFVITGKIKNKIEQYMIEKSTERLKRGFVREDLKLIPEKEVLYGSYGEQREIEFLTLDGIEKVKVIEKTYFYLFLRNNFLAICTNKQKESEFIARKINEILNNYSYLPQQFTPGNLDEIVKYCYELVSTTHSPARKIDTLMASARGDLRNIEFYQEFSYEPLKKCTVRFPVDGEIITIAFLSDGRVTIYRGQDELRWIEWIITNVVVRHFKGEPLQTTLIKEDKNDDYDKHPSEEV